MLFSSLARNGYQICRWRATLLLGTEFNASDYPISARWTGFGLIIIPASRHQTIETRN
jgi:hypothetical protein